MPRGAEAKQMIPDPEQEPQSRELTAEELGRAESVRREDDRTEVFLDGQHVVVGPDTRLAVDLLEHAFDRGFAEFFEKGKKFIENLMEANEVVYTFLKEKGVGTVVLVDKSARFDWVILDAFAKSDGYPLKFNFLLPDQWRHLQDNRDADVNELAEESLFKKVEQPVLVLDEDTIATGRTVDSLRRVIQKIVRVPVYAAVLGIDKKRNLNREGRTMFVTPGEGGPHREFTPESDVLVAVDKSMRPNVIGPIIQIEVEKIVRKERDILPSHTQQLFDNIGKGGYGLPISELDSGFVTSGVREPSDKKKYFAERGPWYAHSISRRLRSEFRRLAEGWWNEHHDKAAT